MDAQTIIIIILICIIVYLVYKLDKEKRIKEIFYSNYQNTLLALASYDKGLANKIKATKVDAIFILGEGNKNE